MDEHIRLVFSRRPTNVSDEEYNEWYSRHIREILAVPGFKAAQRFAVEPVPRRSGPLAAPQDHLALYEILGTPLEANAALSDAGRSGGMVLPDWFGEIEFTPYNCFPRGGRVEAD
jgi:hypothetical protein